MNSQARLLRAEQQAAKQRAEQQAAAEEYGPEWEAKVVKRLTAVMTEQGGPEGLRIWLEAMQQRSGPSRLGVDWNVLNDKIVHFSRLLWRDLHGNRD